ncbi:hypothetical protein Hanom_Chr01g00048871 [Helianthus anomalus]
MWTTIQIPPCHLLGRLRIPSKSPAVLHLQDRYTDGTIYGPKCGALISGSLLPLTTTYPHHRGLPLRTHTFKRLRHPHFLAVMPPPPPAPEQPLPPEPSRRRRSAWMSVRGGFHFSTPQNFSNYPPIFEDLQMGGPLNVVSEVDSASVAPALPPPPIGYENPIPAYPDAVEYKPFEPQTYSVYNYHAPVVDPYI